MKSYVFIGRFQPFHLGHLYLINQALQKADQLIVLLGSANNERTIKNPWTVNERTNLIKNHLTQKQLLKIKFGAIADHQNEEIWNNLVTNQVNDLALPNHHIFLFGHIKDESSYYLKAFNYWQKDFVDNYKDYNATKVRNDYFENPKNIINHPFLSTIVQDFLLNFSKTKDYLSLQQIFLSN